jgi:hypothetical protein
VERANIFKFLFVNNRNMDGLIKCYHQLIACVPAVSPELTVGERNADLFERVLFKEPIGSPI